MVVSLPQALPRASGEEGSLPYWTLCSARTLGYGGKEPPPSSLEGAILRVLRGST